MNKEEKIKIRQNLRKLAIAIAGGCQLQEGKDNLKYPCGTCFCAGLEFLIDKKAKEYKEHNDKPDRINEVWRFLLQLRDTE